MARALTLVPIVAAALLLSRAAAGVDATAASGIFSYSVQPSAPPVLLTGSDGFNGYPAVSPDGRFVAFISDRDRPAALPSGCDCGDAVYVMHIDGSSVRRVTETPPSSLVPRGWRLADPVWSPDGRAIYFKAYVVANWPDPRSNHDSVWRVAASGGAPEEIDDYGGQFALSRDGRYVSIVRRLLAGGGDLRVISTRSRATTRLATTTGRNSGAAPAWSPRADLVAYIDEKGRHVLVATPGGRRRWTISASNVSGLAWSPGGKRIAFVVGGSRRSLWIATLGKGRSQRVVDVPTVGWVRWSPKGDRLFVGGDGFAVSVRPNGRDLAGAGPVTPPRWSPDGRRRASFTLSRPISLQVSSLELGSSEGLCERDSATTSWFCGFAWTSDSRHVLAGFHG